METKNETVGETTMRMLSRGTIRVGKTNPRKRFDEAKQSELTESIRVKGVISPLLVRPVEKVNGVDVYELVAGERRFRSCTVLELDQIPCLVRELTDQQALELQIIENLQRDDLDPIEEAEGFQQLLETATYDAKELAAKLNKTTMYVYGRLKLLLLPPTAQKALLDKRLSIELARLIARIPHKDWREEATRIVLDPKSCKVPGIERDLNEIAEFHFYSHPEGRPLPTDIGKAMISTRYMRELKGAAFDPADAELVKTAGPCAQCPKLTGNSPEIFGDMNRGDVCTDPKCFAAKASAAMEKLAVAARAEGKKVLSEKEAEKAIDLADGRVKYDSAFVRLDAELGYDVLGSYLGKAPKWKTLLKDSEIPVTVAFTKSGHAVELVERKLALTAAKQARPKLFAKRDSGTGNAEWKREQEKRKAEEKLRAEVTLDVMDYLVVAVYTEGLTEKTVKALLDYVTGWGEENCCHFDYWAAICKRRRITEKVTIAQYAKKLVAASHVLALAVEILLTTHEVDYKTPEFQALAKAYKLDIPKIEKLSKGAIEEKEKAATVASLKKDAKAIMLPAAKGKPKKAGAK